MWDRDGIYEGGEGKRGIWILLHCREMEEGTEKERLHPT